MKKKHNYRFLTESILLEESGLPKINTIVIVSVFVFLALFIVWANMLEIEETIKLEGRVIDLNDEYKVIVEIPSEDIVNVDEGFIAHITIPGITYRDSILGSIEIFNKSAKESDNGTVYEALIVIDKNDYKEYDLKETLLNGMSTNVKLITETKSLIQYLLGNLYDTGKSIQGN
jgi:hypothetical protein